jgi:putative transposase
MTTLQYQPFYHRHLPHIQPPGATLFVTFRLVDSIPVAIQQELLKQTREIEHCLAQIQDKAQQRELAYREHKRLFSRWDAALDNPSSGPHWLLEPAVAHILVESLHFRDGEVYDLDTYCIMSNHVHVLFTPLEESEDRYYALPGIMQSLKGFMARKANQVLKRDGQFWQHESYDHIVRDEKELQRIRRYILMNPVRAGVVEAWAEWPWRYCKGLREGTAKR